MIQVLILQVAAELTAEIKENIIKIYCSQHMKSAMKIPQIFSPFLCQDVLRSSSSLVDTFLIERLYSNYNI